MTQGIQEKLAKIQDLLIDFATAIKVEQALTLLTELQEELKPKAVDVEKCYEAYKNECNFPTSINGIREVIAEIERQKQ